VSVINKMLRDLDARRAEGAAPGHPRQAGPSGTSGTVSVPSSAQRPAARLGRWLLPLLLLVVSIAAAWYLGLGTTAPPPAAPLVTVIEAPAMVPAPSASAPESAASAPAETPEVVAELRPPVESEPTGLRKKTRRAEAASNEAPVAEKKETNDRKRGAPARTGTSASVPGQPAAAAVAPPLVASVPLASTAPQRRQTAAQETLAQAQALWSAGSRDAALEVLREAVVAIERAQPTDVALLAQLVREQVRMELALGRPDAVLVLLGRLEPVLSGQADLWAVRGNAAQRLARHQESVQAYLAALRLRPGEPRWMLGAAVSLAALGQVEAAAQQAEQARALGPVSPEVLTYLRQAGVPLR